MQTVESATAQAALLISDAVRVQQHPTHPETPNRPSSPTLQTPTAPPPLSQRHDDDLATRPAPERTAVDELERDVMGSLLEVQRLSQRLGLQLPESEADPESGSSSPSGGGDQQLPAAVRRYSPPPAVRMTTADYLRAAGVPAGDAIATWQRHGSVYGAWWVGGLGLGWEL